MAFTESSERLAWHDAALIADASNVNPVFRQENQRDRFGHNAKDSIKKGGCAG